jgi:CDGSH-type Zn-finger protein
MEDLAMPEDTDSLGHTKRNRKYPIAPKYRKKKIYVMPDGPYEVSGGVRLRQVVNTADAGEASVDWVEKREYTDNDETYYLCRCGHSSKKPFCDGTHEKVDFTGKETAKRTADETDLQIYGGEELTLRDNESLCASMRFCDRGENAWNYVERSADERCKDRAIEEVSKCPSGRLTLFDKQGERIEPELEPGISPIEDAVHGCRGPLWVRGGIEVEGTHCTGYEKRNRVTLCRCGQSGNKPFCDSTHVYCGHMKGFDE